MTDKPIIQASLVDTRNVGTDKELKIELRIPAEHAVRFFEIFGWPTRVSPVPVALCRLDPEGVQQPAADDAFERNQEEPPRHREDFTKLSRVRQAGILCKKPDFISYLHRRFGAGLNKIIFDEATAAEAVRWYCMVESRRDLDKETGAARTLWDSLEADYYASSHGMR